MDPELKQSALTALGRIGTKEAVDAITEFESWSKSRFLKPPPFKFKRTNSSIDHIRPGNLGPIAKTPLGIGSTWAIFTWAPYCDRDIWLTRSKIPYTGSESILPPNIWSEPILLNAPAMLSLVDMAKDGPNKTLRLEVKDDTVTITYNGKTAKASITESQKDSDKDKLSDIVEARLYTDPDNPDTDKDGVTDTNDSNPLTPKHNKTDDVTQIHQAVFSVLFATSDCRDAIHLIDPGNSGKQEYYGYGGFVLRGLKMREGHVFVNFGEVEILIQLPTMAEASIYSTIGNEGSVVYRAKLKKIHGKWVVVEFEVAEVS
jgi:hypothetical protein